MQVPTISPCRTCLNTGQTEMVRRVFLSLVSLLAWKGSAMSTVPIRDTRSAIVGAAGTASISFGPNRANTRWVVTGISVNVSTAVLESTALVTRNGGRISETFTGSSGDSDNALPTDPLWPGEQYTVAWTGADVGARASVTFRADEITGE